MKLDQLVRDVFSGIIDEYHLHLCQLRDDEVLLYSSSVALWIFVDRDGASVDAWAQNSIGIWCDFPLDVFLVKRVGVARSFLGSTDVADERVEGRLRWSAGAMAAYGRDILEGQQSWISEYPWTPAPLSELMVKRIVHLRSSDEEPIRTCKE
jgi:hypothetical protein